MRRSGPSLRMFHVEHGLPLLRHRSFAKRLFHVEQKGRTLRRGLAQTRITRDDYFAVVQMIAITKPSKAWNSMNTRPRMNGWNRRVFRARIPRDALRAPKPSCDLAPIAAPNAARPIAKPAPIGIRPPPPAAWPAASCAKAKELRNNPLNDRRCSDQETLHEPYPIRKCPNDDRTIGLASMVVRNRH